MDAFYPSYTIICGDYSFESNIEFEVHLSKNTYLDWARIKIPETFQKLVKENDLVKIELGYELEKHNVFEGIILENTDSFLVKNEMMKLEKTYISTTFLEATPQEIVEYCIKQSGISKIVSTSEGFAAKTVAIRKKNIFQVIKEIENIWEIKKDFYFLNGCFYWGVKPEQEIMYEIKYGESILNLESYGGHWIVEAPLLPQLNHSHQISITHPNLTGIFEVEKVIFKALREGFIRTQIYIRDENKC